MILLPSLTHPLEMNKKLAYLHRYYTLKLLTVNMSKTKIVIFQNNRAPRDYNFVFNGETIEIVDEYKFLGVIFNQNLNFSSAIKNCISSATKAAGPTLRLISNLSLKNWSDIDLLYNSLLNDYYTSFETLPPTLYA